MKESIVDTAKRCSIVMAINISNSNSKMFKSQYSVSVVYVSVFLMQSSVFYVSVFLM